MNPVSWAKKRGFYMTKLTYENRIEIYNKIKNGKSPTHLSKQYAIGVGKIRYLVRLIDKHGYDILRTTKNKYYSPSKKEKIINRVLLNNESMTSVSIDEGLLNSGILANWIKKYKEMDYNIVERKRGRSTMNKKEFKPRQDETIEEENERLKKENLYLKAELEYSKKLRAVVQARKNQQQKKK